MKTKILVLTAMTAFVAMAETPVRVACIGDSITWGYAMTNRVAECYPTVLQELLGAGYEVRNFGDPGAGVYEHCRREGRPKAWRFRDEYAKVLEFNPDIIVSNLGINDAVEFMRELGSEGIPRGTFRDQYVSLLRSFETDGRRPRFILWTRLGPTGKAHRLKGRPNASLMESDLAEVAACVGAETLDMLTPLVPFVETPDFAKDGIHPEGGAQRVIAEQTLARIDLNAAIARKSREGGGRVIVPGGRHFSRGPIRLKSNVALHFSDGAVVEFSDDPADYRPGVPVSWEGNECYNLSPLVYAHGETNVAVTGRGLLKPRMDVWLAWLADGKRSSGMDAAIDRLKNEWAQHDAPIEERQVWKLPGARFRPQMMMLNRCRNVRLEDFSIRGTPFWTVHLFLCADVVVRGLDIDAYDDRGRWIGNSDGIDIECSRNVLVENCTFRQHDDAIVIKSGKDRDGRRLATPTENVTVRGCTVRGGPTFCAIGSELSGGVRNIRLANCRVTDTIGQFLHVKTNPRRGGFVDGVTVEDVEVKDVRHDFMRVNTRYFYGCPGEEKLEHELLTPIRNLTVRNVHAASAKRLLMLDGDENIPVEGVTLENVRADRVQEPDVVRNVKGFRKSDESETPLTWGGRPAHPAVVNPVTGSDPAWVISLRGEWQFSKPLKDLPNRNGIWGNFNARQEWAAACPMSVPSCWEAQGVGEPGPSVSWDPQWDECSKPIRHKYMGEGWYRRTVTIPASWKDRRVWLKVGGVKSVGWIWVNDVQVALVDSYCGTEKYEITDLVRPGEAAKIVVDVDNRKPSRKGLMSIVHRWGGIYRDIELEATPQVFVDDVWVRGDFDGRLAEVHVEVGGRRTAVGDLKLRVTVEGEVVEQPIGQSDNPSVRAVQKVALRDFRPWSPEHPNLYTAKVELVEGGRVVQTRLERFGVRKLEVCGKEFRLNGKPFYVRGFGDDFVYPLTGLSPADRDVHRAHLRRARAAGFNAVRLHTHCEVPEYFEAADELGLLIQVELPYYSDVPCEGFAFDPKRDVTELWRNYRRHPSFAVYSMGNEGSYGKVLDERLHRYVKAMDPDRLKINQDAHRLEINRPECADFAGGPTREWPRGTYDPDRPFVTHEYLNLCVKSDSRDEAKYVGAWLPPATRKSRGEWLAKFGLGLDWGDRLQDAQHALQGVWQKRGIEAARLDPFCDGYSFWTLVDVVVWNARANAYSAQGLFNPFWETKRGGRSPESFAAFNSPSCVLVDFCPTQSVFVAGESFRADVFLAHYGDDPLVDAKATWSLSVGGDALASGVVPVGDQPLGAVRKVASVPVTVPSVSRPSKAAFAVDVGGVRNSWDVWLFPKGPTLAEIRAKASRAGVVIAASGSPEAKAALAAGRPLVTVDGVGGAPNVSLGWWWMGAQVGTAIRPHRALGDFPHEGVLTPLWFRLLKKGAELPVPDVRPDDMIVVGEGGEKCYLYLCERTVGKSRVMECHGLDLLSDLPEGNCLLAALVEELSRFD